MERIWIRQTWCKFRYITQSKQFAKKYIVKSPANKQMNVNNPTEMVVECTKKFLYEMFSKNNQRENTRNSSLLLGYDVWVFGYDVSIWYGFFNVFVT